MDNNYNIDDEIERTMKSLDGIQSAEPNPFFYTRLKARMEKELTTPRKVLGWQVKPIYALSALAIVLVINVLTFITVNQNQNSATSADDQSYSLYDANDVL